MRTSLLFTIFILIARGVFSQNDANRPQNFMQLSQGNAVNKFIQNDPSIEVIGSPYLNDAFVEGWVLLKNLTDTAAKMNVRFNAIDQSLEAEKTATQYVRLSMPLIASFGFLYNDEKLVFVNASKFEGIDGFPELVFSDKDLDILLLHKCSRKVHEAQAYESNKESIHYSYSYSTFIVLDGKVTQIRNRKELNQLLSELGIKPKKIKNAALTDRAFLRQLGMELSTQ